jgi:hypothetical protein
MDSLLEESGFEPLVPLEKGRCFGPTVIDLTSYSLRKETTSSQVGPGVRIRLAPAERWYGAGDEEMAPSSL